MSPKGSWLAVFAASSVLFGAGAANAQPVSPKDRPVAAPPAQVAALPAPQGRGQATRTPLLRTNELRTDPRWPRFKACIDSTATPDAFRSCLQNVFPGEMTAERPRR